MPVKRNYARQYKRQLEADLQEQLLISGTRVAMQLERLLEKVFKKTLRFSSQFGTEGLQDATIEITSEVMVGRKGLMIKLTGIVVDGAGNPHMVWHILNYGRDPFIQRRTSPVIRARSGLRTTANSLMVGRFPGYSGDEFVIPAGTLVAGIDARNWYQEISQEYRDEIQNYPSIVNLNLKMVRFQIRDPDYL